VLLGASPIEWYVARAGGMLAFVLLTLSMLVGIGLAGRVSHVKWPRFAVEDLHGYLGVLAAVFLAVHVGSILLDDYIPFSLGSALLPGASSYRTLPVAFGVVAAELLAALAVTNRYRRRLPHRLWRRLHYANFAVWACALVHGMTVGTDRASVWGMGIFAAAATSVCAVTAWRIVALGPERSGGAAAASQQRAARPATEP
jgi:sulfoxide reductase heme-binding subunit YedZ